MGGKKVYFRKEKKTKTLIIDLEVLIMWQSQTRI